MKTVRFLALLIEPVFKALGEMPLLILQILHVSLCKLVSQQSTPENVNRINFLHILVVSR